MTTDSRTLLLAAQEAIRVGQRERARQLLRQAIRQNPGDYRSWLWLAGLSTSPNASLAYIDRAAALNPGDSTIDRARAWAENRLDTTTAPEQITSQTSAGAWLDFGLIALGALLLFSLTQVEVQVVLAPLSLLRLFAALVYVLFVPGYLLQLILFPRAVALEMPGRLALSLGLSVALIPPLALILDRLPWGVRMVPILAGYGVLLVLLSLVAGVRRLWLPPGERFRLRIEADLPGWWAHQERPERVLYVILLVVILLAVLTAAAIIVLPRSGEQFTEFYVLGPEGFAEDFPYEVVAGQPVSLTLGVNNRELGSHTYRVEVWAFDPSSDRRTLVAEQDAINLDSNQNHEWPLTWSMPWVGDDQQVQFLLYIDQNPDPYRQLRLWLNVIK